VSIKKYYGEQGDFAHGGERLYWPGTMDGYPVRTKGMLPDMKKEEAENIELQLDFKSKMFELWDPAQKSEFDEINDKIINGWYLMQRRNDHWDEDKKHFRVWLEWAQVYGMIPPKVKS
jgi:hypothetical protein